MFEKQKKLIKEATFATAVIRGEGLDKVWMLIPETMEDLTPIVYRELKTSILGGKQVKEENFVQDSSDVMTIQKWKIWLERQKSTNKGYYVRVYVWDKKEKKFTPISQVEGMSGLNFYLLGYHDQVVKKMNRDFNKSL